MKTCYVTSITATYLDCCLSSYFNGSNAEEVLAVPIWAGITYREAHQASKDAFHMSIGYFDDVSGSGTLAEDALHALFSGVEDVNAPADFAQYIEPDDDCDGESVYLYIALRAES